MHKFQEKPWEIRFSCYKSELKIDRKIHVKMNETYYQGGEPLLIIYIILCFYTEIPPPLLYFKIFVTLLLYFMLDIFDYSN